MGRRFFCITAITVFSLPFLSGTRAVAQPMYHSYIMIGTMLQSLVGSSQGKGSLQSLGKTAKGNDIWVVTVGGENPDSRPAVLIVGGADAARLVGSEIAIRCAAAMLSDRTDSLKELLNHVTLYIIPRANPDAAEQYFAALKYERRGNGTPTDDDRDGETNEDGYDDLNSDGMITQMRVYSQSGEYISDTSDTRLLRKANKTKGERGVYDLYTEGRDNDGDGKFNEDGEGGVDVNRNFTFNYPFFKPGAGANQISEIESRAIADFCYNHPNIAAVVSFTPQNNLLYPWEVKKGEREGSIVKTVREGDDNAMKYVADMYAEITGMKDAPPYEAGEGSFTEWAYYHFGRFSFGTPGWWPPKPLREVNDPADSGAGDEMADKRKGRPPGTASAEASPLKWLEQNGVDAFVPWQAVAHPDFPGKEVEVGGVVPYALLNPPPQQLDSLARAHTAFIRWLGGALPSIQKEELTLKRLGPAVHRLTLKLINTGILPTNSAMGKLSRVPRDVKIELTLPEKSTLSAGRRVQVLGAISGGGGSLEVSWVIAGNGTVTIDVGGPMAGGFTEQVELR